MRRSVISEFEEPGSHVELPKMWKEDLHGMDHGSLIVAAELVEEPENQASPRTGVLAIFDQPERDYDMRLDISPQVSEQGPPRWSRIQASDLDGDGKKEVVACWYDGSASGFENYVAVIGWDQKGYMFEGTIPPFESAEGQESQIVPAGHTIEMSFKSMKDGNATRKSYSKLRNCTHLMLKDIDQDGKVELLCAHMIWPKTPRIGEPGFESHGDNHSYLIRILELDNGELRPDYAWNQGQPLFIAEKMPAHYFIFTKEIISSGLPDAGKDGVEQ